MKVKNTSDVTTVTIYREDLDPLHDRKLNRNETLADVVHRLVEQCGEA